MSPEKRIWAKRYWSLMALNAVLILWALVGIVITYPAGTPNWESVTSLMRISALPFLAATAMIIPTIYTLRRYESIG